jgi:hypothetical protein
VDIGYEVISGLVYRETPTETKLSMIDAKIQVKTCEELELIFPLYNSPEPATGEKVCSDVISGQQ